MQLNFTGKNIEVTPALKSFTAEKFNILEKRYPTIHYINIVFYVEHMTQTVEATLHFNGLEIHATAKDNDMYKAIELLADKLQIQLNKHKQKNIEGHR